MLRGLLIIALALAPAQPTLATENAELRAIRDADQSDRTDPKLSENWRELTQRDKARRDRVVEILKAGQVSTSRDHLNAALVLQHGSTAEDIRIAHSLSTLAATLDPENREARWLMAASWDRLLLRLEQPQWYGTQWTQEPSGKYVLEPVQPNVVSDADRVALGVPTLAESKARVKSLNNNE